MGGRFGVGARLNVVAFAIAVAAVLAALALRRNGMDAALFLAVNRWRGVPDVVWELLSVAGLGLTGVLVALLAARRRPRLLAAFAWSFVVGGAVSQLVKHLYRLPRPASVFRPGEVHVLGPTLFWNSMPSGHALTAALVVTALWLEGGARWRRPWMIAVSLVVAVAIGVSRVAAGAHFPSDVLAGAVLGWASACLSTDLARRTRTHERLAGAAGQWLFGLTQAGVGVAMMVVDTGFRAAVPMQLGLGAVAVVAGSRTLAARVGALAAKRRQSEVHS